MGLNSERIGTSVAAKMIATLGATGPVDLPVRTKVDEMLRFFVSDAHVALREHLGIAVP